MLWILILVCLPILITISCFTKAPTMEEYELKQQKAEELRTEYLRALKYELEQLDK